MLGFDELTSDVESKAMDTVVVAFTDMQGGSWQELVDRVVTSYERQRFFERG